MPLRAINEVRRYLNNSITAFENRMEREYQDQLELGAAIDEYHDELREEFEKLLEAHGSFELPEMYKLAEGVKQMAKEIKQREEPTP